MVHTWFTFFSLLSEPFSPHVRDVTLRVSAYRTEMDNFRADFFGYCSHVFSSPPLDIVKVLRGAMHYANKRHNDGRVFERRSK